MLISTEKTSGGMNGISFQISVEVTAGGRQTIIPNKARDI
jgi:hypothetical protein